MDNKIIKIFEDALNDSLVRIVISNSTDKEQISKIKIRPIMQKGELHFHISEYKGEKVFHSNDLSHELIERLPRWFEGLFRQAEIVTHTYQATILFSKKGKATVLIKSIKEKNQNNPDDRSVEEQTARLFDHNKKKNYILQEGEPIPFLVDLGVMTTEGRIVKAKSDKFRQINRFLEYIEDILPYLNREKELTILDFGCGKSYLTFAIYYYLKIYKGYQINVIGLDLKKDVIAHCNMLSKKFGYDKLQFLQGDIASYNEVERVDMVVTLHACDTATDHALYKAVAWGADVILSVPCCQHELNRQIKNEILQPILNYGILKERISALITDGLRAELLETMGYKVQLLEFIDMEHTPKNILIRAVKRKRNSSGPEQTQRLEECIKFLGVNPSLKGLLENIDS